MTARLVDDELRWVGCGPQSPRLDLLGHVVKPTTEPSYVLTTVAAIRIRNTREQDVILFGVEEFELEDPFPLVGSPGEARVSQSSLTVSSVPGGRVVLEGLESPAAPFLDLLTLAGWRLELWMDQGSVRYRWTQACDWGLETASSSYPTPTFGELRIEPRAGSAPLVLPWPFASQGRLELNEPVCDEGQWTSAAPLQAFAKLFDAAGPALADFPISRLVDAPPSGALSFHSRLSPDGLPACELRLGLSTSEAFPLLEFAGQRLALEGSASMSLSLVLGPRHVDLNARVRIPKGSRLHFNGPPVVTLEEDAREMLPLVSANGTGLADLDVAFTAPADAEIPIASARLPARWDAQSAVDTVAAARDALAGLDVSIDGSRLVGFRLGSIESASPRVQLRIVGSRSETVDRMARLILDVELSVESFDPLVATWSFTFDLQRLSLRPSGTLEFKIPHGRFDAWGVHIEGLRFATATWQNGQLVLTATHLRAFYDALSSPGDPSPGFELDVPRLRITPAGVDVEMLLRGGAPKLIGIGESFKGVDGVISFVASRLQKGFILAQGPLPWLDNATGSVMLVFREGLVLDQVKAEFQLGLHRRVAWWFELDLKALRIDIDTTQGRPILLTRVTGAIEFRPPAGASDTVARHLGGVRLELNDLLLTRAFTEIPAAISPVVEFHAPAKVSLFGVFEFEMRSLGLLPSGTPGEAAVKIGGQVFFSSSDLLDLDVELHDLMLEAPAPGSLEPRLHADGLRVRFRRKPIQIDGAVRLVERPERRGFEGGVRIAVADLFGIDVWCEMARVVRATDGRELRAWTVFGAVEGLDVPLVPPLFLRDAGIGFGWRKTLAALDDPDLLLQARGALGRTAAPHLRSSWIDDLDGEDARWTVVLAAWITLGAGSRSVPAPLAGDMLLSLRSDLTLLAAMRGWFMQSLDELKSGEAGARPAVVGRLLVNPSRRHLLAEYAVDPAAAAPRGVPDFIAGAFLGDPFPFVFETRQDYFRLEVAWPRQLKIPMGSWMGRAGFLVRVEPGVLTVGMGLEFYRSFETSQQLSLFGGRLFIAVRAYLGIWGELIARLGADSALFGRVGLSAILVIEFGFELRIKIGWFRIEISISFGIEIILSATLEFGISGAGVGFVGIVAVSVRIWKFGFGGSVALAVNGGAVDAARNAVLGGTAGDRAVLPPSVMPDGDGEVPRLGAAAPTWTVLSVERDGQIFVLLLPKKDTWFARPSPDDAKRDAQSPWAKSSAPDYSISFTAQGAELDVYLCAGEGTARRSTGVDGFVAWNARTTNGLVGDVFYEPDWRNDEIRLIEAILNDSRYRPELLVDWRVRAERSSTHEDRATQGLAPGVRSPRFTAEDSLYDTVLQEACSPNESLSWQAIAVGMTEWEDLIKAREGGAFVKRLLADADLAETAPDQLDVQLVTAAERWHKERSGLAIRLLEDFRSWSSGAPTDPMPPLLAQAGVALRFRRTSANWSIRFDSLRVRRGAQAFEGVALDLAQLSGSGRALGFAARDRTYRVRDVLEFQDDDSVHFSWRFECIDESGTPRIMTHEETSGLSQAEGMFSFFDHYEVVRVNLSRDDPAAVAAPAKARPGYIPALVELGDDDPKKTFFVLAPRFDFTDRLDGAAATGDVLMYRITAIDTFNQRSQTIEHVMIRRDLRPPAAPQGCEVTYRVRLDPGVVSDERLEIAVRPAADLAAGVFHEIWVRSYPIGIGGYFGFGDEVDDDAAAAMARSAVDPQGMTRLATASNLAVTLGPGEIAALGFGRLNELFVRAVAASGAASRLVRCEIAARIGGPHDPDPERRSQAFLERIPPPTPARSAAWVSAEDMRVEVRRAQVPRPGPVSAPTRIERTDATDAAERRVTLRFLHESALDDVGVHPTGGYEVLVRDRDATVGDELVDYRPLAEVEVVPLTRYRSLPRDTSNGSAWNASYLRTDDLPAFRASNAVGDGEDLAWLDWGPGPKMGATPGTRIATMPDEGVVHFQLEVLLFELQERCRAAGIEMIVRGAPPSRRQTAARSFATLVDEHTEDKDPNGARLLHALGRSVDVYLGRGGEPLDPEEVLVWVRAIVESDALEADFAPYLVMIEILVHADRSTRMSFHRLSLQPRLRGFGAANDDARRDLRVRELESFRLELEGFGIGAAGAHEPESQDSYQRLVRRFLRQQRVAETGETIRIGVAWFESGGSQDRPLHDDDTVSVPLYYKESYARRFAYRVRRLSRYVPLYRELRLWSPADVAPARNEASILVRLPRVKPPAQPIVLFLGSFSRADAPPSAQWIIEEHEEEAMVQSNETLRNRLGFRGVAWMLHAEPNAAWLRWSGWTGAGPALTELEQATLETDAAWADPDVPMPGTTGLENHPFVGLLRPKGTVVRVPRLPYYYRYRLAAFARTDDVDSPVKVVDAAQVFPTRVPAVDVASSGWRLLRRATATEPARLELWWRVPSVWLSLEAGDRAIWKNEAPFASRIWDFDLGFDVKIQRHQVGHLLLTVRLDREASSDRAAYAVKTGGSWFFERSQNRIETLPTAFFPSAVEPEIRVAVNASMDIATLLERPEPLALDLWVSRPYGSGVRQRCRLARREPGVRGGAR
jgi:hypothetical protein